MAALGQSDKQGSRRSSLAGSTGRLSTGGESRSSSTKIGHSSEKNITKDVKRPSQARLIRTDVEKELYVERKERKLIQVEVDSAKEEIEHLRVCLREAVEEKKILHKSVAKEREEKRRLEVAVGDVDLARAQVAMSLEYVVGDKLVIDRQSEGMREEVVALEGQMNVQRKARTMLQNQAVLAINEVQSLGKKAKMAKLESKKIRVEMGRDEAEVQSLQQIVQEVERENAKLIEQVEAKKPEIEKLRSALSEAQVQKTALSSQVTLHTGSMSKQKENTQAALVELRNLEAKAAKLANLKRDFGRQIEVVQRQRANVKDKIDKVDDFTEDLDEHLEVLADIDDTARKPKKAREAYFSDGESEDEDFDEESHQSLHDTKPWSHSAYALSDRDLQDDERHDVNAELLTPDIEVPAKGWCNDLGMKQYSQQSISTACTSRRGCSKNSSQRFYHEDDADSWVPDFDDKSPWASDIDWDFKDFEATSEAATRSRRGSFNGGSTTGGSTIGGSAMSSRRGSFSGTGEKQVPVMTRSTWVASTPCLGAMARRDQYRGLSSSRAPSERSSRCASPVPVSARATRTGPGETSPTPIRRGSGVFGPSPASSRRNSSAAPTPRSSSAAPRCSSAAPKWS